MQPAITLNFDSESPIHRQVYEAWRQGILSGRFACASRVPSTRELSQSLGVARSTITQAYEQLIAEGYLESRHGSGTFVCAVLPEKMLQVGTARKRGVRPPPSIGLSDFGGRLQDDFPYPPKSPGTISFSHWWPNSDLFPSSIWRRLMQRHLRSANAEIFIYSPHVQGIESLRREIAHYLARVRAVSCTPGQVIVVNGSQQGLYLCARLLFDAGDEVAIENPGYLGARRVFLANGAKLRPVPVDGEGIVCRELGKKARAVYVTPSHQFPMGVSLSLPRRLQLIAWAREHQAVIIEDDYDSEFRFSGAPLPSLQGLSADTPVIYCGSFSKVMFPGLRIGYLVVPPDWVPAFRRAKWLMDRNTPVLEQSALADFLSEGHLDRHIRRMRRLYAGRYQTLVDSVQRHFGEHAQVYGDAAGMHACVRIDDDGVPERAKRHKVQIRSSEDYYLGAAPRNEFVFGFAPLSERTIREGIKRLAG